MPKIASKPGRIYYQAANPFVSNRILNPDGSLYSPPALGQAFSITWEGSLSFQLTSYGDYYDWTFGNFPQHPFFLETIAVFIGGGAGYPYLGPTPAAQVQFTPDPGSVSTAAFEVFADVAQGISAPNPLQMLAGVMQPSEWTASGGGLYLRNPFNSRCTFGYSHNGTNDWWGPTRQGTAPGSNVTANGYAGGSGRLFVHAGFYFLGIFFSFIDAPLSIRFYGGVTGYTADYTYPQVRITAIGTLLPSK